MRWSGDPAPVQADEIDALATLENPNGVQCPAGGAGGIHLSMTARAVHIIACQRRTALISEATWKAARSAAITARAAAMTRSSWPRAASNRSRPRAPGLKTK